MESTSSKGADMTTTTRETKTRFTEETWDGLRDRLGNRRGVTRETAPRGWMHSHDLAVEAYEAREDLDLPFEAYRDLVSAASSGLPIIIRHRDGYHGKTETTRTYIVEQFIGYGGGTTSNLYVRSWGFAFPIALSQIVSVEVPEQTFHS